MRKQVWDKLPDNRKDLVSQAAWGSKVRPYYYTVVLNRDLVWSEDLEILCVNPPVVGALEDDIDSTAGKVLRLAVNEDL